MGEKALQAKRTTRRRIRGPLSDDERARLLGVVAYEGSPLHKSNPGDFGLIPPASPRADKTLCDEAGVVDRSTAAGLLKAAVERGLASEAATAEGYPKQLWIVDECGQVFEAMYGGSVAGRYHGYPIRASDPFSDEVHKRLSHG